ncbi:MAG TPA: hypothetical protein VMU80_19740 [Bryobacteraceae bacterium]|nr:hypothetical protein [Bryobacteraceae bacterium]
MNTSRTFAMSALSALLLAPIAFGQQDYVGRYDVFTGYMYLRSPLISLGESGFHTQFGTNPTKWYSMGFDFSIGDGDTVLVPNMLKSSVQQEIATQLEPLKQAGLVAATYEPAVPLHSRSETYALGPQLNYRHFRAVTLFVHPDLGAIHETAITHPNPKDLISTALVTQLAPAGTVSDWTYFYGVGGGMDVNVTHRFGIKLHVDFVRDHLFSDFLPWRNSVRFSVGPVFHAGPNVAAVK